jgi:hypothetical protein
MNTWRHLTVRRRPRVCLVATAALFVIAAGVAARRSHESFGSIAQSGVATILPAPYVVYC